MRLIDADQFEVIAYKDTAGRENTFDAGVQYMAEMIDAAPTVRCIDADALLRRLHEEQPYNWTDSDAELQAVLDWDYFCGMVEAMAEEQNKGTGHPVPFVIWFACLIFRKYFRGRKLGRRWW